MEVELSMAANEVRVSVKHEAETLPSKVLKDGKDGHLPLLEGPRRRRIRAPHQIGRHRDN